MALLTRRSTALWRGYLGTWEIRECRLWLVQLDATVGDGTRTPATVEQRGLEWLFPDRPAPVFADWFTGEIESPRGRAQRTSMYSVGWPYLLRLTVAAGVVTRSELIDNRQRLQADKRRPSAAELIERLSGPLS